MLNKNVVYHVSGLGHHTDQARIPLGIHADGALLPVRQILTHRAGLHAFLGVHDGLGEFLRLPHGEGQDIKRQPLGGFGTDAGELAELLCQPFQGHGKIPHLEQSSQIQAAGELGHVG